MKRLLMHLAWMIASSCAAWAQTSTDPNEGSRFVSLGNNNYQFSWWARPGAIYLVELSNDLITWHYDDTLYLGLGGIAYCYFPNLTGERQFVRLQTDPLNTDSDGDGMPDGWEVLHGLNAHLNDAAGNPDNDGYNNLEEYALGLNPYFNEYGAGARTQTYSYDNASRVTGVEATFPEAFTYDAEGNLTNVQ